MLWAFTFTGGGVTIHASDLHVQAGHDADVPGLPGTRGTLAGDPAAAGGFTASFRAP